MTEIESAIPFSGIDPRGRVKFSVLLEMFQMMADADAWKYNLSVRQTLEHNITWVLRKYRIDLKRYPTKGDRAIRIKTWAEPYGKLFSLRTFKLWNSEGEFIGSAYTWWVLLDATKLRPIRIDKSEIMTGFMDRISEELPVDVKVQQLVNVQIEELWKVRWQDLDVNDHTNHTVYFSWALDTVPYEVPDEMTPMFVECEFLHPIPRTTIKCVSEEISSSQGRYFLHSLRHTDDDTEYAKLSSIWR